MSKKLFISLAILVSIILFFTTCFAANEVKDAMNSVGNTLTNVKDGVENTMKDAGNAIGNTASGITDTAKNVTGTAENTMNKDTNNKSGTGNMNNGYTATRTSANGTATFMGMTATAWTWLILGIAALAIIAAVWYYSMQNTTYTNTHHNRRS